MTRPLFRLAPAPIPREVELDDDPEPAPKPRRMVKPDGRVVRLVPVAPRCRFGMESEREPRPRLDIRPSLPPIPENRIEVLPPAPSWVPRRRRREWVEFHDEMAAAPSRPGLDPVALAVARRVDPWAVMALEGFDCDLTCRRLQCVALAIADAACRRLRSLSDPATAAARALNCLFRTTPRRALCLATRCVLRILIRLIDRARSLYALARQGALAWVC